MVMTKVTLVVETVDASTKLHHREMSTSLWENGKFEPQQRRRWRKMKKMFPIQTEKKKKSKVGKVLQHLNTDSSA